MSCLENEFLKSFAILNFILLIEGAKVFV